jgi:hypothetical protein
MFTGTLQVIFIGLFDEISVNQSKCESYGDTGIRIGGWE